MVGQIVAAALIEKDGKYFVAKRSDDAKILPGKWEFPAGKVKPDERPRLQRWSVRSLKS